MRSNKTVLLLYLLLLCSVFSVKAQTNVSGIQTGIWTKQGSPYILTQNITVPAGQKLTIEAGVEVQSKSYNIGITVSGTLVAKGTASEKIRFTGFSNTASQQFSTHGGSLNFSGGSVNSVLDYVVIDRWGDSSNGLQGAIVIGSASVDIQRCEFKNSEESAIFINGSFQPLIQNNTFSDNPFAISCSIENLNNVFENTNAGIRLRNVSTTLQNITMPNPGTGSYYQLQGGFTVAANAVLTIKPGAEIRSYSYSDLINISGTLIARGTASVPIKFTGFSNEAVQSFSTHGGAVSFNSTSVNNIVEYVVVDRWGDSATGRQGAFVIGTSSLTIQNSLFKNSEDNAIFINGAFQPVIKNNAFSDNLFAIYCSIENLNNVFENPNAGIRLRNITNTLQAITLPYPGAGSYYQLQGGFTVAANTVLTIEPGVEIRSYSYGDFIYINGTLIARGTATEPIKLNGFSNEAIQPFSTHGGTVYFNTTSVNNIIDYVIVDRWGDTASGRQGAFVIGASSVTIQHSIFKNSEDVSVYIQSGSPTISQCIFTGAITSVSGSVDHFSNVSDNENTVLKIRAGNNTATAFSLPNPGNGSYYHLLSGFNIKTGTTLTIDPGAIIKSFSYSDRIYVEGTLLAKGSPNLPIQFQGFPAPGGQAYSTHGGAIQFAASSVNSVLDYVIIDRWGDTANGYQGAVYVNSSSLSITNCTVQNSEDVGIFISAASPTIQHNFFNSNNFSISATCDNLANIKLNNKALIKLRSTTIEANNVLLPHPGTQSNYQLEGGFTVKEGNTFTIEPGTIIWSKTYNDLITINGTLVAKGSTADPIKFVGFSNEANQAYSTHGGSIRFSTTSLNSVMEYVDVDRWGDNANGQQGAIVIQSSAVSIKNSNILNSKQIGINVNSTTALPSITQNTFNNNAIDIQAYYNTCGGILNNTNAKVTVLGNQFTTLNAVWPYPGTNGYYVLNNEIVVPQNTTLTIEAGTVVNFGTGAGSISVNGNLRAIGTEVVPIKLIRTEESVNNQGGYVNLNSSSRNSTLSFVQFDKLGTSFQQVLGLSTAEFTINNITISNSKYAALRYTANGSPTINNASFFNNKIGVLVQQGKPIFQNCNIYGNSDYGILNQSSTAADIVDATNCYWGDASGPLHATNPGGLGNKVSDKVLFKPFNTQPNNGLLLDIGVSKLLSPITNCQLGAQENVKIQITNHGNLSQTNFKLAYRINNADPVTETVSAAVPGGATIEYTFKTPADLQVPGKYKIVSYTLLVSDNERKNDSLSTTIDHLESVGKPVNLSPEHLAIGINLPLTLSWAAVNGATAYDIYLWKQGDAVAASPQFKDLEQSTYTLPVNMLAYGTTYNWKIVARRGACSTASEVQVFTTKILPDLIVERINVPAGAVSETEMLVSWKIKNQGTGATENGAWTEVAYLSDQPVLSTASESFFIGSTNNFSALDAGQSYQSAEFKFKIPQGKQGLYYVIVQANYSNGIIESNYNNNNATSNAINITLAPPPDLQVTALTVSPLTAFSEDSVLVTYKVKNLGTGPTTATTWRDHITIGKAESVSTADTRLFVYYRLNALAVNQEYTVTQKVKIPAKTSGTHYIHVITDAGLNVFEYTKEDNNSITGLPLNIIQRPTPNLTASHISISVDSASANQNINIQWNVANEGALATDSYFEDAIYLSEQAVFDERTALLLSSFAHPEILKSLENNSFQKSITVPQLAEGKYYIFVKTDRANQVFEYENESDNVTALPAIIQIVNPDLSPVSLEVPATAISEQRIAVQWKVKNNSRGAVFNTTWTDKFYLSANKTFEAASDILISTQVVNQLVAANGQYSKQTEILLPEGLSGDYYVLLRSDADNVISEKLEDNNLITAPIHISLSPFPDLQVPLVTAAAKEIVGTQIKLSYTVANKGNGNIDQKKWVDYVYLSPTANLNETNLVLLSNVAQSRTLLSNETYTQQVTTVLPVTIIAGTYHILVKTDFTNTVFEATAELNNAQISKPLEVVNIPNVDLAVIDGELLTDVVKAGQAVNLKWTVKNTSNQGTVINSWKDAVYLSNNAVLDPEDILLGTVPVTGMLGSGVSYTKNFTVTVPQSAEGSLYFLLVTDKDNQQNDINRGNNFLPLSKNSGSGPTVITTPEPADLVPLFTNVPAVATASQPFNVSYDVKNVGTGPTPVSLWSDQFYISNGLINIQLTSISHSGAIAASGMYHVDAQVFLPAGFSGNYVLKLKTDATNVVFERGKEDNNEVTTNLFVNAQLPSDLVLTAITNNDAEHFAGENYTVTWELLNQGANLANGFLRDAVYLSKDERLDADDILFGTLDKAAYLPPQAKESRTLTKTLVNVTPGEYYVIVKTDILNNIVEQNEANNVLVSPVKVSVAIKELKLNLLTNDKLANTSPLYYRIVVPADLAGETFSLTLKGDSVHKAVNRIFIKKDSIPTANRFDFAATVPFEANQQIIVPSLSQGTYYLTVLGATPEKTAQEITLKSAIIPFKITTVSAPTGGNTGAVTIKITGAKFEPGMVVKLSGTEEYTAGSVFYVDQSKLYATFGLNGAKIGKYTVSLVKPGGATVQLENGFEVITGTPGGSQGATQLFTCKIQNVGFDESITLDVVHPESVRRNQKVKMTIAYTNAGNVDIPAQSRILLSLEGAPVNFTPDFAAQLKELYLELIETDGPPGILRAGTSGYINIYTHAIAPMSFVITQ